MRGRVVFSLKATCKYNYIAKGNNKKNSLLCIRALETHVDAQMEDFKI